ncbi:transmembrane protein 104 homolog isoform X2 [Rhodnius prolixus]|uniref:transmembrane protein 104 homolog isoform X2 n=1 Tax=Rhodnius prolixus TaxID=13249 RepID=UPI003D18A581
MDDQYSSCTALLYIFNLIVGTGALTLPKAFTEAGWLFSSVLIVFLALVSYITATFVIESMAISNAIIQWQKVERMKRISRYFQLASAAPVSTDDEDVSEPNEDSLMLPTEYLQNFPSEPQKFFTLDIKVEMSEMATTLYSKSGQYIFYICLCLYLYGDLTIYSAAVAKTIVDTSCTKTNVTDEHLCWESYNFTRRTMYKLYLGLFLILFGPYVFFNVQKTKYLQFFTSGSRWLAFSLMIGLGIHRLLNPALEHGKPKMEIASGLPTLLGSCVYSFMCHHSLPSLIMPIKDKSRLFSKLALDYMVILLFYLILALTAVFAFPNVLDLYTLNFVPDGSNYTAFDELVSYFLALFPVFTLTASFPIIAVTLRSNLQAMFAPYEWRILHLFILPLLAVIPPIFIAMSTENIEALVGVTGSFAGVIIQYVIPATLVMFARKSIPELLITVPNFYSTPFKSFIWPLLVIGWAAVSIILVTYDIVHNRGIF